MRKLETRSFFNARHRGSSQLIRNERIRPDAIHDPIILRDASDEYMYLDCIVFIKKAKKIGSKKDTDAQSFNYRNPHSAGEEREPRRNVTPFE